MAERREQEAGTSPPSMDRRTRRQPLDQWGGEISRKFMISCCHHQQRSHRAIVYSHRASLLQYSGWFENIAVQHSHKSYKCTENYAQQTQHYDERQCMTKTTFLNNSVSRQNCAPQDDSGGCLGGLLYKSVQIQNVLIRHGKYLGGPTMDPPLNFNLLNPPGHWREKQRLQHWFTGVIPLLQAVSQMQTQNTQSFHHVSYF